MAGVVDWKMAPRGARWWAVDANGDADWFSTPNVAAFTDFWLAEQKPAPAFGFDGNWKESLTERPTSSSARSPAESA